MAGLIQDDPRLAAHTMLMSQRQSSDTIVGAFGQMITIDEDGAYTELLCRWPDVLGKKINRAAKAL